ncbi:hypothetical protein GPECTOR_2g1076 [Gonium pectorale]|uniref:CRAL-TRIO domain-containing protein n=1 Tax=Gonium pectorale TaxID=33097 RepID=A0A150H040_GONPE|nr:hypothetical protein GPECTOR_2g1076 [Gonium pectorale]|eukprot:KXZ55527.1 hypothetical protein GPECTOR_2g1076 [Gonium pectorale]
MSQVYRDLQASSESDASAAHEPPSWSVSTATDASTRSGSAAAAADSNPVSEEQIANVRSQLQAGFQADDATIRRFVRATGGNLALSAKRLNTTLAWRAQVKPEQVVCNACARDGRSHYMHLIGFCKVGRPIIYSCLEVARNKVFEDNKAHMLQTFEWAIKCMPPGVEQWIWVCDFKGFGMADVNPKLAKLFLDISAEYYPERLGLFLVVDAPSLFGMLWRAISGFVDPKTYKKIRFLPFDASRSDKLAKSSLKAEMDLHFDPVTTAWLIREMNENRDKAKAPLKLYNMYSMYEQALGGELCDGHELGHHNNCHHGHLQEHKQHKQQTQVAAVTADGSTAAVGSSSVVAAATNDATDAASSASGSADSQPHNLLGTPALLHTFNMRPDLLLPQATASG